MKTRGDELLPPHPRSDTLQWIANRVNKEVILVPKAPLGCVAYPWPWPIYASYLMESFARFEDYSFSDEAFAIRFPGGLIEYGEYCNQKRLKRLNRESPYDVSIGWDWVVAVKENLPVLYVTDVCSCNIVGCTWLLPPKEGKD